MFKTPNNNKRHQFGGINSKNLPKIGELIAKKPGDRNGSVDKTVKKAFNSGVKYVEQHEADMIDATKDQQRLYEYIKNDMIQLRQSTSWDELEHVRKKMATHEELIKTVELDSSNAGQSKAQKFISKLISDLQVESKPSSMRKMTSGLFGASKTSVVGKLAADVKNIKSVASDVFGVFKEAAGIESNVRKKLSGRELDKEIGRLAYESTTDSDTPQTPKEKNKDTQTKEKRATAKSFDPGIVSKNSSVGDTVIDPSGKKYQKTGTGWKDLETGKVVKRHQQSSVEQEFEKQSRGQTSSRSDGKQKISTITVDKIIAKNLIIGEGKKERKESPRGSVENKPFKASEFDFSKDGEQQKSGSGLVEGALDALGMAGGKGGAGLLKRAGGAAVRLAKSPVGKLGLLGGAAMAAGAGVDTVAGAFGVGKDKEGNDIQVDTKQDDENWNKMNTWEKVQSGAARGIEKAGRFLFMDNIANEAASSRISKESEYLGKNKPTQDEGKPTGTYQDYISAREKYIKQGTSERAADVAAKRDVGLFGSGASPMTLPGASDYVSPKETMMTKSANTIPAATEAVSDLPVGRPGSPSWNMANRQSTPEPPAPSIVPVKASVRPNESAFNRAVDRSFRA